MKISIPAVLVGGVVDVVSSAICLTAFMSYEISKVAPSQRIGHDWTKPISTAADTNVLLHLAYLLCSMVGGYVAAVIAKRHEHLNGALASWLRVGLGTLGMLITPTWLDPFMLVGTPVCAFVGGDLRLRVRATISGYDASAPTEDSGNWGTLERSLRSQRSESAVRVDGRAGGPGMPAGFSPEVRRNCYALIGLALALDVVAGILFWFCGPHSAMGSLGILAIFAGLWLIRRALDLRRNALAKERLGDLPTTLGE